jgi:hypothetical protein
MMTNRIASVAARIMVSRIATAEDVSLLRDLTLPGGFITRDEAADLVRIERHVSALHESWGPYFVETVGSHLAWEARPVGRVSEADALWLIDRAGLHSVGPSRNTAALMERWTDEGVALPGNLLRCVETMRTKAA